MYCYRYIYWPKLSQCGLLSYNTPSKDNVNPDKHTTASLSKGATYRTYNNGTCLASTSLCDGQVDCTSGEDELHCFHTL